MPSLLDLPTELLTLILEEVGGHELRRTCGGNKLLVCRRWHDIARPIYISSIEFRDIRIFGHSTGGIKGKFEIVVDQKCGYSELRRRMQKNTRQLRLRLLGHWWDEITAERDEDADPYDGSLQQNEPSIPYTDETGELLMADWRDNTLRSHIDELFGDLHDFTALEDLVIEFSSEPHEVNENGPYWDYIYHSTISRLLRNLPIIHDLTSFTLDTSGTGLLEEHSEDHLCDRLAGIIPRIKHVRLRMRRICPSIFKIHRTKPSEPRIKTMVLKLHLPSFKDTNNLRSEPCSQMMGSPSGARLHQRMARASQTFLAGLSMIRSEEAGRQGVSYAGAACHGMDGFRMTYADDTSLITIDFLTLRIFVFGSEFFIWEDIGAPCWFELVEEDEELLDRGPFVFGHS